MYCFHLQLITYGRRIPVAELFARIDAVDANTIKRVANRFIFDRVILKTMENFLTFCIDLFVASYVEIVD